MFESTFETRVRDVSPSVAHNCSCSRYIKYSQRFYTYTFEGIRSSNDWYEIVVQQNLKQTNFLCLIAEKYDGRRALKNLFQW